jgi:alpha-L-fucosidase
MKRFAKQNTRHSRRQFVQAMLGGAVLGNLGSSILRAAEVPPSSSPTAFSAEGNDLPKPSARQLAWQDCELGMFFHFDIPVFKPGWDWRSWKDMPQPNDYNPAKLNTDQWLEAARSMGAKYAVFVAKHCSGFLQWQSDCYPYGVRQSAWRGGKGDVLGDFVASCHKYGIKPGIYASVTANGYLEVDNPGLVNRGKGGDEKKQAAYVKTCERMLTELWSRYGEMFQIWFDGGALPPEKGGPNMLPILEKYQPQANVCQGPNATNRFGTSEAGVVPYPYWNTVNKREGCDWTSGDPNGKIWIPGEACSPMPGHAWFWFPDQNTKIEPLGQLMDMYYRSVGHGCNLLLNATPGPDGLIPEPNMRHYADFGKEIRRRFEKPLAGTQGEGATLELTLPKPSKIDHAIIMEDIAQGQRVRKYDLEGLVGGDKWQKLCDGDSIGHKRIQKFPAVEVAKVRFHATQAAAMPKIRRMEVFCVDAT